MEGFIQSSSTIVPQIADLLGSWKHVETAAAAAAKIEVIHRLTSKRQTGHVRDSCTTSHLAVSDLGL